MMKKLIYLLTIAFISTTIVSCTGSTPAEKEVGVDTTQTEVKDTTNVNDTTKVVASDTTVKKTEVAKKK